MEFIKEHKKEAKIVVGVASGIALLTVGYFIGNKAGRKWGVDEGCALMCGAIWTDRQSVELLVDEMFERCNFSQEECKKISEVGQKVIKQLEREK